VVSNEKLKDDRIFSVIFFYFNWSDRPIVELFVEAVRFFVEPVRFFVEPVRFFVEPVCFFVETVHFCIKAVLLNTRIIF
jgi:hypothetical protein